ASDTFRKRLAVDEFENEVAGTLCFQKFVYGRDVGVIQRCQYFGFTLKASYPIRISRELFRQNLDRDVTLQLQIASTVNFAHAAAPTALSYRIDELHHTQRSPFAAEQRMRTFGSDSHHRRKKLRHFLCTRKFALGTAGLGDDADTQ